MNDIRGIYIITEDGTTLLHHERFIPGSKDADHALFQQFVVAFQGFLHELGARGSTTIELGNSIIYTIFNKSNQLYFVLKCRNTSRGEKMMKILNKVHERFTNMLAKGQASVDDMGIESLEKMRKSILKLVTPKKNVETFLAVLWLTHQPFFIRFHVGRF